MNVCYRKKRGDPVKYTGDSGGVCQSADYSADTKNRKASSLGHDEQTGTAGKDTEQKQMLMGERHQPSV